MKFARRAGIPCVATYHTFFEEYLHHYVPVLAAATRAGHSRKRFTRSQCRDVQALIAPSEPMRDVLLAYGVTTPIHVLPTGLPADRFKAGQGARFRSSLDLPADRPLDHLRGPRRAREEHRVPRERVRRGAACRCRTRCW